MKEGGGVDVLSIDERKQISKTTKCHHAQNNLPVSVCHFAVHAMRPFFLSRLHPVLPSIRVLCRYRSLPSSFLFFFLSSLNMENKKGDSILLVFVRNNVTFGPFYFY